MARCWPGFRLSALISSPLSDSSLPSILLNFGNQSGSDNNPAVVLLFASFDPNSKFSKYARSCELFSMQKKL